jgi:hypothetical protein
MCENPLCLQLRRALSAAFSGEPLRADTTVGEWARGFMKALQEVPPDASYPHGYIWHLASGILLSTYARCPCEGLIDRVSCKPEAFLRSVLLVAKAQNSRHEGNFRPSASLH